MNRRKKNCFIGFFTVILCVILNVAFSSDKVVVRIVGNENKYPKIYNDNENAKGILVDILKYIEVKSSLDFNIRLYPWKRAYDMAQKGEAAIIGLSKNNERLSIFDYSKPIYYDEVVLVVCKGKEFEFNKIEDLKGKVIGGTSGASYGEEYDYAAKSVFKLDIAGNYQQKLLKLLSGHLDAVVVSPGRQALNSIIAKDSRLTEAKDNFVILERTLFRDPNYIGFKKKNDNKILLDKINTAIDQGYSNGDIPRIISKWDDNI